MYNVQAWQHSNMSNWCPRTDSRLRHIRYTTVYKQNCQLIRQSGFHVQTAEPMLYNKPARSSKLSTMHTRSQTVMPQCTAHLAACQPS